MRNDKHRLRRYAARAAAVGSVAVTAALTIGAGVASAAPSDPVGGATPVAPHFYNGNVEAIRGSGSDTTFFLMQRVSDLFTGAGLYGCTLNADTGANYNTSDPAPSTANEQFFCQVNDNVATTDVNDNWDRTEVQEGVDDVGSGAGQGQLCNSIDTPLAVDFARSSKPAGSIAGCNMVETGYAKDGVPIIDYPVNPSTFGTSTSSAYSSINGGVVGPVANGWLPGDPTGGPFSGSKLTNIANNDNGGGINSTAYRIWCATNGVSGATNQITDWGQLTNIGPNLLIDNVSTTSGSANVSISSGTFPSTVVAGDAVKGTGIPSGTTVVSGAGTGTLTLSNNASATGTPNLSFTTATKLASGQGLPVGIPIRVMGVNTASGTESTFQLYAESGVSGLGCASNMDANAANDPNPATAPAAPNNTGHIALENNSDQIDQFAASDFPSPDFVDQAIEAATTLYIESNGVFNTNPYAATTTINGTGFSGFKLSENGQSTTTPALLNNIYPTARTLFNIYNSSTVRASTGGFLNWICDGNSDFSKGLDNSTGSNFDTELSTLIGTTFGFPRLTDQSAAATTTQPADNQPAPNTTCAANRGVTTTSGQSTITVTGGGNFPSDIVNSGGLVGSQSVGILSANFPAGTTVVSGAGTSTLTLSSPATGSGTAVSTTFLGVPAVTAVASSQN
jgi:hypothetical protein